SDHPIGAPHRCKSPSVPIAECLSVSFPGDPVSDRRSYVTALLDRNRSKRGERLSFVYEASIIANHKDVWMPGDTQVVLYLDSTGTIHLSAKPFSSRRTSHPRHPDDSFGS